MGACKNCRPEQDVHAFTVLSGKRLNAALTIHGVSAAASRLFLCSLPEASEEVISQKFDAKRRFDPLRWFYVLKRLVDFRSQPTRFTEGCNVEVDSRLR